MHLLHRRRDSGADDAVSLGGELQKPSPTATDVEQPHAGLQLELAAHEVEFRFLRRVEVVGVLPVAARVDHPLVEHPLVQVVADVVVALGVVHRAALGLMIAQRRTQRVPRDTRAHRDPVCGPDCDHSREHLVESVAIPPAVHVRLAESELALRHHPRPQPFVVHTNGVRFAAANRHACFTQQVGADSSSPFAHRFSVPAVGDGGTRRCCGGTGAPASVATSCPPRTWSPRTPAVRRVRLRARRPTP